MLKLFTSLFIFLAAPLFLIRFYFTYSFTQFKFGEWVFPHQLKDRLMLKLFTSLFIFLAAPLFLIAQIIWTDPVFPTPSQAVTVYFDATKGTGGLANCNCDVYVHTGLITSKSTSPTDWKYTFTDWGVANDAWKMTPVEGKPNQYSYEIQPNIKEKYGITDPNEEIQKLAFVFRDANGSKEGKASGGGDIFYDVYADDLELTATLTEPTESVVFAQIGAVIPVRGASSLPATLSLFDNGTEVSSTSGTSLEHNIMVSTKGVHLVELIADNGTVKDTASFTYVAPLDTKVEELPEGMDLGINYTSDTSVLLALNAPRKNHVFLIGDFNDWQFSETFQMKRTSNDIWWIEVGGLTPGQYYAFQYVVDGSIRTGDPYCNLILDPANDKWIPEEVFPNMPPYPSGKTTDIVSLMKPGTSEYPWQITDFERPPKGELVIYELLMRDFLHTDYENLSGMLDYFEELGINAIELMPVNEFSGNNSWGYNPTYHHALDKAYGTPDAFKGFVDACHARGIAVIVDVVFNHAHEKNPLAMLYWDDANFRPAADNPWLNPQATHDFSVFFDFNHESEGTRNYVKRTLSHYLEEYNIDGFRFDLSKGFTQNATGPFDAGAYDASRISFLKEYADEVWSVSDGAYVILEHFAANSEETELSNYGAMFWSGFGPHNEYLEGAMGYSSNFNSTTYQSRVWNDPHLITYIESHDEERLVYKCLKFGNESGDYSTKELSTALDRSELASTFFYTIPGPKMLWQFGELGYDLSINRCPNGTESESCRTDPKPINWEFTEVPDRVDLYNVVRSLLHLRNNYEAFHTRDFQLNTGGFQKTIHLNHASMNVAVLGNFAVTAENVTPNFQHTGWWYEYFSGDSLNVSDPNAAFSFEPGEYRLYTDVRLQKPDFFTSAKEISAIVPEWRVFPNPSTGYFQLQYQLEESAYLEISLFDLQGRKLKNLQRGNQSAGVHMLEIQEDLAPGMYFVRMLANGVLDSKKVVVLE